jgi:hypothetical protein
MICYHPDCHAEVGQNTTTVVLRDVEGDEKGTRSVGTTGQPCHRGT